MRSLQLPQPAGLQFREWGALVAEQLAQYGVSAPLNESDWKSWVCALFYVSDLVSQNIPSPEHFPDWRVWAERFIASVR